MRGELEVVGNGNRQGRGRGGEFFGRRILWKELKRGKRESVEVERLEEERAIG